MVALDSITKSAQVALLQTELNDGPGVCMKISGGVAHVTAAVETAKAVAGQMQVSCVVEVIAAPDPGSVAAYLPAVEFNPLIEQMSVHVPEAEDSEEEAVAHQADFAVGLIETQGFTAVFEAIDTAIKAADVEVLAREKLGGGYIAVLIKGDVAAVTAAIEAGKSKVEGLGRLIAAHVIASPSRGVLSLLPRL
jgi:carbon dioxide concentrating mechanism protein CcmO